MNARTVLRTALFSAFFFLTTLMSCAPDDVVDLGENDRRYAAFYADYLVMSGVSSTVDSSGSVPGADRVDSLLVVHGLTLYEFNERSDTYSKNPRLWRAVLLETKSRLKEI